MMYTISPVLNGQLRVLTKNSSNQPPTVMIPGTTPYSTATTTRNERNSARSEPLRLACGTFFQNPTLAPAIEKSDYEPKTPEANASVDADTVNDATAFLETFFKLYPTATEKELAYYVSDNVLEPIGRDYLYSELVNPIFTKDGDNVKVKVAVKFLDNQTKATQVSQYELVLHKDSNWKIVG